MTSHSSPVRAHAPLPEGISTLADHERHARGMMDAPTWAYLCGAAADELTFARNMEAWRTLELLPRVLKPLAGGHTRVNLLGRTLAHPILVAPMAYQRLAHPDGEHATTLAAAVAGVVRTVNVAPRPGADCATIAPPCRRTMRLTIAKPMPLPGNSSSGCSRRKASNN